MTIINVQMEALQITVIHIKRYLVMRVKYDESSYLHHTKLGQHQVSMAIYITVTFNPSHENEQPIAYELK